MKKNEPKKPESNKFSHFFGFFYNPLADLRKLFKGKKNPRIYCKQYTDGDTERFVIIGVELLEKKKAQKVTAVEKSIIRRVA